MRHILSALFIFLGLPLSAQVVGGENSFEFLRLAQSAHISALGGVSVVNPSGDASMVNANPANKTANIVDT